MSELRRFLVKASMDSAFRERVRTDPEAAFAGFSLTDAERDALRRPDEMLPLIARETLGVKEGATPDTVPGTAPDQARPNPSFYLRIFPSVVHGDDGQIYVSYSGTLDPSELAEARHIPWSHRLDSPETAAAVEAIRAASPEVRRAKLLALIRSLVGP